MKIKRIGALLAAGALLLTFAGTALATAGSTKAWTGNGWPISTQCGEDTPAGYMLWIFHDSDSDAAPVLTVNGSVPTQTATQHGNSWHIVTPYLDSKPSTQNTFVTYFAGSSDQPLTISHGCPGGASPSPSESTPVESESVPPSDSPSPSESTPVESESPSASIPVESESPSASIPVESESPSTPASESASTPASPSGSVEAETGTPQITPPSTDTVSGSNGSSSNGLPMVLGAASLLLIAALVATPSRKRSRR